MMAPTLLALADHEDALAEPQREVGDGIEAASKPVAGAAGRHDNHTFYACGTGFALAAAGVEKRQGGRDYFDFIRPVLDAHRSDRAIGRANGLALFAAWSRRGVRSRRCWTLTAWRRSRPSSDRPVCGIHVAEVS